MGNRRIIIGRQPINPVLGGKAGAKVPGSAIPGNVAGVQWDMVQRASHADELQYNPPPQISYVRDALPKAEALIRTIPTRVLMYPRTVLLGAALGVPALLVPKNPKRLALVVCNTTADSVVISFGPFYANNAGQLLGLMVLQGSNLQLFGDSCPTDEIWVYNGTTGNRTILAFEGLESLEANQ